VEDVKSDYLRHSLAIKNTEEETFSNQNRQIQDIKKVVTNDQKPEQAI
jgi:bisphosphoglycerate-independent phosphoglycerate mutase (AlkP superfamily)